MSTQVYENVSKLNLTDLTRKTSRFMGLGLLMGVGALPRQKHLRAILWESQSERRQKQ